MLNCVSRKFCFVCTFFFIFVQLTNVGPTSGQVTVSVDSTQIRSIEGVSDLERSRFFNYHGTLVPPSNTNLGNLQSQLISPDFFHATAGRTSTEFDQFITNDLDEDGANPSFLNPFQLVDKLQGDYRNFVVNGSRWAPLRDVPQPFLVNAGRSSSFWPSFFRTNPNTGITSNFYPYSFAYAEFLTTYLDEVVYGPNAFLPIESDRMVIELLNEPELHLDANFTTQDMIDYHRLVAIIVKGAHPQARVIGPSLAITSFHANNFERWNNTLRPFIEGAGADLDGYSYHPYERYHGFSNGTYEQDIMESPGRVQATIDLIQNHNLNFHGELKPLAITEYGSWNLWDLEIDGEPFIGEYSRDLQQWDMCRNIKEKMFVFMGYPHIILNATPFVSPRDFRPDIPTNGYADNVFFEQDANGNWSETIVGNMFRLLSKISGKYISNNSSDPDLQVHTFRNDDTVFIMLNNLKSTTENVDLQLETGSATAVSATMDRIYRQNDINTFVDDQDVIASLNNLVLNPEECAVVTVQLSSDDEFVSERTETTHYCEETVVPIAISGTSGNIDVDVDTNGIIGSKVRVCFTRPGFTPGETFFVVVNNDFSFPVTVGELDFDDNDYQAYTREIDIPFPILINGTNQLDFHFGGNGGHISSAAIVVVRENNLADETVQPSQVQAESGMIVFGGTAELESSDDSYLLLRPGKKVSQPAISLLVDATSNNLQPSNLTLNIESSGNTPNLSQTIQIFNWTSSEFEVVDSSLLSQNDDLVTIDISSSAMDYINQVNGAIQARIDYQASGLVLVYPWSIQVDQLNWTAGN